MAEKLDDRGLVSFKEMMMANSIQVDALCQLLIEKGIIKASNFKNSRNKLAYSYLLTPKGVKEKVGITASFLKHKLSEFDALKNEIETLIHEVAQSPSSSDD